MFALTRIFESLRKSPTYSQFFLVCVFLDLAPTSPSTNTPHAPVSAASTRAVRRPTACNFRRKLPLAAAQTQACLAMVPRPGVCARVSTLSGQFRRCKAPSVLLLSFSPCFRPKMGPTIRFPCFRAAQFQRILCSSPPATCWPRRTSCLNRLPRAAFQSFRRPSCCISCRTPMRARSLTPRTSRRPRVPAT
jgi:hypothetical protein